MTRPARLIDNVLPIPSNLGLRARRIYRNVAEEQFRTVAKQNGWEVSKRGWPDFVCVKNDEIIAVEVKPTKQGQPKLKQFIVLQWLANHGVKAYIWNPESGFRRVKPSTVPP